MKNLPSVCLVDEEAQIVEMYLSYLCNYFQVRVFTSGRAAIDALAEGYSPDVVVTDWGLPRVNITELLNYIVTRDTPPPVIVTSARAVPEDFEELIAYRVSAFLAKPFGLEDLRSKIENMMQLQQVKAALFNLAG